MKTEQFLQDFFAKFILSPFYIINIAIFQDLASFPTAAAAAANTCYSNTLCVPRDLIAATAVLAHVLMGQILHKTL